MLTLSVVEALTAVLLRWTVVLVLVSVAWFDHGSLGTNVFCSLPIVARSPPRMTL